jgi:hypothetical protein
VPVDDIVLMPMADYGLKLYGNAIIINPKFAAEKPEAVRAFLHAFLKGLKDIVRRPVDAVDAVVRRDEALKKEVELERLRMAIRDNIVTPEVKANGYGAVDYARLGLDDDELDRLRAFAPRFAQLCGELAAHGVPETAQHDDLHGANVYARGGRLRLLDWGDASVSHPFASLVVTFRFLEERNKLPPADPWFGRLRDAYLEPWGAGLADAFALALRVGTFAHVIAWQRQRDHLPAAALPAFDRWYPVVLRRAVARTLG